MGTLFKRTDRGGKAGNWYAQYIDAEGNRVAAKSTGTTDKTTAKRILAKWESESALRRHGVIDATSERISDQASRPIKVHLDEFEASIRSPGNSDKHVSETMTILKNCSAFCHWQRLTDITRESVESYTASLREQNRSNRTIQRHIGAIKQLTKWATATERIASNRMAGLKAPTPSTDRRIERRAILPDEWPWLRDATISSQPFCGLPGSVRALLYELCIQTGLRQNEVRQLTAGKCFLDQTPPFIQLPSRSTKNKKPARQYITKELANRVRKHLEQSPSGQPMFALPNYWLMADMIRHDFALAREVWLDKTKPKGKAKTDFLLTEDHEGKRIDFHALRHTCGAWLAMAGENPKTIQSIMRHSTITLTMDTYGHLFPAAESDAIARLGARFAG